jgi:DNA-binding NarL/FixJ family response regulator
MTPSGAPIRPNCKPITVLVVDDHPLLREGVAAMIAGETDIRLIAEAANGQQAVERFHEYRPDVTLMDLELPIMDGIQAIKAIRRDFPTARIIVLTTYKGDAQALASLKAGASGYLLKSMLRTEMLDGIRTVHAGRRLVLGEVAQQLAEHAADEPLSEREIEILRGIAEGSSSKQIALRLRISPETVRSHTRNILAKLGAHDRTHAVMIAVRRGIIRA